MASEPPKPRVLFLCTGNSARSQMAQGWLRALAGERFRVVSAGTHPTRVNPLAIAAMRERGVDISHQRSKSVTRFLDRRFEYVITVCDQAAEACPSFPGAAQRLHWSFADPAAVTGDDATRSQAFSVARDAIEARLREWLAQD